MANVKNFGLAGVGGDLQFGKAGTRLINNAGVFNFKAVNGTSDAALTAAGITSSAGNVTLTTGDVVMVDAAGKLRIGGTDMVQRTESGLPQLSGSAAVVIPAGNTAARATGVVGAVRVNSDDPLAAVVEYFDGTKWAALATGGNATELQAEVDRIETTLGTLINADGSTNVATALSNTLFGGATDLTTALNNLASGVQSKDTLEEILAPGAAGSVIYSDGTNWLQAAPGATSGVQGYDAGLAALAAKTTTGIMVQTGDDTYESRTLVAPAEGFTITNADGVAGNPTFALSDDLAALEGLASTGFAVRTADNTWEQREITGAETRIVVDMGDGVDGNPLIDLANVEQSDEGNFNKFIVDAYGRVVGITEVTTADITALVDATYVNVNGDTMTGDLNFGGSSRVTGLASPVNGGDATNKAYVDNAITGLTWKNAVAVMSATNVDVAAAPATIDNVTLAIGDRVLLKGQTVDAENGIYVFTGAGVALTRAADTDAFDELNGAAVFVKSGTQYANTGWTQNSELTSFAGQDWAQFSGAGAYSASTGIDITGTTISVRLGAGIVDLPTGEVGVDLYDTGALMLTVDGTARSTNTAAKLGLMLEDTGGLSQSATGLRIKNAGVTNAMMLHSALSLGADTGAGVVELGDLLRVIGTSGQGVSTSVSGSDITVTVADATDLTKGVASFNSASFTVTAGAVSLNVVDVAHGGTGKTSFVANQLIYGDGTNALAQSANLTFDGTSKVTIGGAAPVQIDGATATISATSTNSDLTLLPNGTGSVVIGNVGDGVIESDTGSALTLRASTVLTLESVAGGVVVALAAGTTDKVNVSGPTAAEYATGLADTNLVNKYYADTAIATGVSGSIKAVKATVPLNANGTVNIGAAIPAGATVLSVKAKVVTADGAAVLSVGKAGSTAAYMDGVENDAQSAGMYMAETYVTEAAATQIIATVSSSSLTGTGSAEVIVQYQLA